MSSRRGKRAFLAAGAIVILGGIVYLFYGGLSSNLAFFLTPSELHAKGESAYSIAVRLGGQVQPGSVKWDAEALDLRFIMTDGRQSVTVHSRKAPPQMFREGMGVVVEGRLNRNGVFESSNVMVKHSNEYKAPHPGQKPEDVYKSLIRDQPEKM